MSGKIFPGSANVYEDQAQVLFDYYRQAAEQIVKQEEETEKQIAVAREEDVQFTAAHKQKKLFEKVAYGSAGLLAVITILLCYFHGLPVLVAVMAVLAPLGFGIYCLFQGKTLAEKIAEARTRVKGFESAHKEIARDFKIHKLGVAYVPVAGQVAFEGKSFLVDYTGTESKKEFRLSTVRKKELFASTINDLEGLLKKIPIVEQSSEVEEISTDQYSRSIQKVPYYDYLGGLNRKLRAVAYCLGELETTSVEIPVIFPETAYAKFLADYGTATPDAAVVFPAFDIKQFDGELATFQALNQMKKSLERHSRQFEQVLRSLMVNIAGTVQAVTELKMASTSKLVESSNRLFFMILKAPYNHYSPKLEADEIERIRNESFSYQDSVDNYQPFQLKESSRVLYDPISQIWVAEDGSKTNFPFGMQQLHEEIIAPIVQSLMQETRLERLKIYHSIQDQKSSYLNKWHQDTEDFYGRNRAESADLINLMRSSFTDFIANYNTLLALEQTEKQMAGPVAGADTVVKTVENSTDTVASYNLQRQQYQSVQEDFAAYIERLKEDIDRRAEKFQFIEYYDASLRDDTPKSMSAAGSRAQSLDNRRKPLLAVNPFYAESSELAPQPVMEELANTHFALNLNALADDAIQQLDSQGRQ
jgi:hypothetical protein